MTEQDSTIPILESLLLHDQPIKGFLPITAIQKEIERLRQCEQSRREFDAEVLARATLEGVYIEEVDEYGADCE